MSQKQSSPVENYRKDLDLLSRLRFDRNVSPNPDVFENKVIKGMAEEYVVCFRIISDALKFIDMKDEKLMQMFKDEFGERIDDNNEME